MSIIAVAEPPALAGVDVLSAVAALQRRCAQLERENARLRAQLEARAPGAPFTIHNLPPGIESPRTFRWHAARGKFTKTGKAWRIEPDAWFAYLSKQGESAVAAPCDDVAALIAAAGLRLDS